MNFNQVGPASKADYGDLTGQFAKLANLWSTYTIEGVTARFTPGQTAAGTNLSPVLSIVDVIGGNNSVDFA